jgi:hypothetical protein
MTSYPVDGALGGATVVAVGVAYRSPGDLKDVPTTKLGLLEHQRRMISVCHLVEAEDLG